MEKHEYLFMQFALFSAANLLPLKLISSVI